MSSTTDIPETHKACVYDKPGTCSIAVNDVPTPEPGPGEVLVKLTHSGVCHSDYGISEPHSKNNPSSTSGSHLASWDTS
jgi:propanol-preferring alcohol dehydrogenase